MKGALKGWWDHQIQWEDQNKEEEEEEPSHLPQGSFPSWPKGPMNITSKAWGEVAPEDLLSESCVTTQRKSEGEMHNTLPDRAKSPHRINSSAVWHQLQIRISCFKWRFSKDVRESDCLFLGFSYMASICSRPHEASKRGRESTSLPTMSSTSGLSAATRKAGMENNNIEFDWIFIPSEPEILIYKSPDYAEHTLILNPYPHPLTVKLITVIMINDSLHVDCWINIVNWTYYIFYRIRECVGLE